MTSLKKNLKICQTLVHPCVLRAEISWSWAGTAPLTPLGDSVLSNLPQSSPLIFIPKTLFPSCHLPACCNECKLCHKGLVSKDAPPQMRRLTHARPGHRAPRASRTAPGSILAPRQHPCSVQAPPQLFASPHASLILADQLPQRALHFLSKNSLQGYFLIC